MAIPNANVPPMPKKEPANGFWTHSDELGEIRDFARSRGASPYAMCHGVLRRAILHVPPHVVLPATLGSVASVNLFTAPVGESGAGKDIANGAARDAVQFFKMLAGVETVINDDDFYIHPGTGEGLARIFHGDKKGNGGRKEAHLQVPDIATLEALADRKGQTLVSQLLHAYMGQPIGFSNSQKDTTTAVGAHSYRLCLSVGVQPENAAFFLSREKDGFPQRFLWSPTLDPYALEDRPAPVAPQRIELPRFPDAVFEPRKLDGDGRYVIEVPDDIKDEVWRAHWLVNTGAPNVDPLDSHLKLTQLKVAFALAVLHGRIGISHVDWKLGAHLIDVSNSARTGLRDAVENKATREDTVRAHRRADQEVIVRARLVQDTHQRIVGAIKRKLKKVKRASKYDLRQACTSTIRDDFDTVFDVLIDKGRIVSCGVSGGQADEFEPGPGFL